MMGQRVLSALVGLPILIAVTWFGGPWFTALVAVVAVAGVIEFYRLAALAKARPLFIFGSGWTLLFIGNAWKGGSFTDLILSSAVLLSLLGLLLRRRGESNLIVDWGCTLVGILYLGWTLGHFISMRSLGQGPQWVLLTLLATFASDTSAFLVGRAWGRHPLAPRISPAKTWEGALGGMVGALVVAIILSPWVWLSPNLPRALILGGAISLFAQLGDLSVSLLKRGAGVKDAGWLVPGHGGLLDRLDSVVFTVVVVYYGIIWGLW